MNRLTQYIGSMVTLPLVVVVLLAPAISFAAAVRPNVLLICVDDLKPALGCYGDPLAKTPNVDRIAARGMRFEIAYCNQAVCAPSRNNLLLGSRSTSIGVYSLGRNLGVSCAGRCATIRNDGRARRWRCGYNDLCCRVLKNLAL